MEKKFSKKLIVILGPTASGKSDLAIKLAKKFKGEIVSADSRQVYKGMDIGTGKINQKEMKGVPHHLLDVVSPKKKFNVTQYRKLAIKTINKIHKKGKTPILCGGTGFYIQAVVDGLIIPEVKPDWKLREKLEKKSTEELFDKLKKLDSERAQTIERKNKRRLIRALEIVIKTKRPIPCLKKKPLPYPVLMLELKAKTKNKIAERVNKMFNQGLEKEVESLIKKYGWVPALQTIGYQEWKQYFENELNKSKVKDLIILHTRQFARCQMTWFKRDKRIHWIKKQPEAEKLIKEFLRNK